ncbi:MAG: hypothetical protein GX575_04350 [Candidatus Anammoximicrobium sp.]|nr:hypothetical protein [Candidatus Anammoximicrobium sp.]
MARKRRRRTTLAQVLIGAATAGLPQPIRSILKDPSVSTLIMIAAPILLVTGVVSIRWDGTLPSLSVDQQRAHQIQVQAQASLQKLRQEYDLFKPRSSWDGSADTGTLTAPQDEQPIANLSEILRTMR